MEARITHDAAGAGDAHLMETNSSSIICRVEGAGVAGDVVGSGTLDFS